MDSHLKLSPDLMAELLAVVSDTIVIVDLEGKVRYFNRHAEKMLGYTAERIVGSDFSTLFMEDDLDYFLPNIMKMTVEKSNFEGEIMLRHQSGRGVFGWLSSSLFAPENDKPLIIVTVHDIDRLKRIEHRFIEAERFAGLGRMAEQIAHQFRNPLTTLGGFARRMLARPEMDETQRDGYLVIMAEEARRLEEIIREVSALASLPAPVPTRTRLGDVVQLALDLSRSRREKQTAQPQVKIDRDHLSARFLVDGPLWARGLSNMVDNAVEAVEEANRRGISSKRKVMLTGRVDNGDIVVEVTDSGCGIASTDLDFIFDPFFTTKHGRVGMGLTVSKRLIEDQGGIIEVESQPQVGSRFKVRAPRDRRRPVRTTQM